MSTLNSGLLDVVEAIYLRTPGWSAPRVLEHLNGQRVHGPGCPAVACHCPLKYPAPGGGPYSLRSIQVALQKVRERLRAQVSANREANRALAVARYDLAFQVATGEGNARDMIAAASRRAELDGSHVAAEEASRPSLYARVRALMVTVVDYEPGEAQPRTYGAEQARFQLERLERLLIAADEGAARYRRHGEPPKDEAERLIWRRNLLDESIHQTLTSPHVHPDKKRDVIIKGAGTASMITEGSAFAEDVAALKKSTQG